MKQASARHAPSAPLTFKRTTQAVVKGFAHDIFVLVRSHWDVPSLGGHLNLESPAVSTGACGCGMHQFFWSILTHTTSIVSTNIHNTSPTKITIGLLARLFPRCPQSHGFFCTVCVTEATIKLPHLKVRQFWEKVWAHLISEILDAWVLTNGNH